MLSNKRRIYQMEYKNDNRTPRDRLTDDFLSELLDCECEGQSCDINGNRPAPNRIRERREYYRPANSNETAMDNCSDKSEDTVFECGCGSCVGFAVPHLHKVPLAMVYSPHQQWENIYEAEMGLKRGTIFKCLDFPFMHAGCDCKMHGRSMR